MRFLHVSSYNSTLCLIIFMTLVCVTMSLSMLHSKIEMVRRRRYSMKKICLLSLNCRGSKCIVNVFLNDHLEGFLVVCE